jgi:chromosome segregation protein
VKKALHKDGKCRAERSIGEERKGGIEAETAGLEQALAALKSQIEELREVVTDKKVRAAALREKKESNLRAIKRVEDLAEDLRTRITGHGAELDKCARERQRLATEIAANDEKLNLLLKGQLEAEASFMTLKERYDGEALAVQEEEAGLKGVRACGEEIRQSIAAKKLSNAELVLKLQNLESSLLDKYRLSIASLLQESRGLEYDDPGVQARCAELQKYIDEMGDVNLMAIEEYKDLTSASTSFRPESRPRSRSTRCRKPSANQQDHAKRFAETFQQVNAKFQEVFLDFCGGRTELKLTNERLLETGIDIIVQPPGCRTLPSFPAAKS